MPDDYKEFFRTIYGFFAHGTRLTYASIGVGLLIAFLYFGIFFGGVSGFWEDFKNAEIRIPFLSKNYDYVNTQWSKDKIMLWVIISVGSGALAYYQLPLWFPHLFAK
jgi:hypothetical protein